MPRQRSLVPDDSSWILPLHVPPSSATFSCVPAGSHTLLPFSPLLFISITRCDCASESRNFLICRSLRPSSIPAWYLSVVLDIRPFRLTPSLLSAKSEFVFLWQWDLCEPSVKRDPHSLPFWCCLASICKRTNNANNATHYVKLGKKRRESSKRNYYIISPGVIIKAIIIKHDLYRTLCPRCVVCLLPFCLFFLSYDFVSS